MPTKKSSRGGGASKTTTRKTSTKRPESKTATPPRPAGSPGSGLTVAPKNKPEKDVFIGAYIPPELEARLQEDAKIENRSKSQHVSMLIAHGLAMRGVDMSDLLDARNLDYRNIMEYRAYLKRRDEQA